jgi:hypothetical protein
MAFVPVIRAVGANSVSFESGTFAVGDALTYAALKAAIVAYAVDPARKHDIYGLKNGQLFAFLSASHDSAAAALTAFAEAGGLLSVIASDGSTTALPVIKVGQSSLIALVAATGAGCVVRLSFAASISA